MEYNISVKNIKLSFVIPCYRSENTIRRVVEDVISVVSEMGINDYEIILVNDCSPDNVWCVIEKLAKKNAHISGISFSRNFGQHAALMAGYSKVSGDIVVSMDDDGQTPIDELNLLLDKLDEGYDVVYAYYETIKQNAFRRFGTFMATKMGEVILGSPKGMKGSSFFAAKKYVIDEMQKYSNPYPYIGGLILRITRNISCVMTHHRERMEGKSGYTFRRLVAHFINGYTAFSVKPLRVGTYGGFILSAAGFVYALIVIIRKVLHPEMMAGWSSTISILLIVGGMIMAMLGMMGEYIGRIYICINNAPQYVIKETVGSEQ